jgi:hypothetical protein
LDGIWRFTSVPTTKALALADFIQAVDAENPRP